MRHANANLAPYLRVRRVEFTGLRVLIYGDIAIATGSVVNGGDRTVFTDVFARRDGRWQAINAQENAVQAR